MFLMGTVAEKGRRKRLLVFTHSENAYALKELKSDALNGYSRPGCPSRRWRDTAHCRRSKSR
jgi:hypothetical protein